MARLPLGSRPKPTSSNTVSAKTLGMTDDERKLLLEMAKILMTTEIEGDDYAAFQVERQAKRIRELHNKICEVQKRETA